MAVLELRTHIPLRYSPHSSKADEYGFIPIKSLKPIKKFPYIYTSNGTPWHEANRYALSLFYDAQKDYKTVLSSMKHLTAYAHWLEENKLHWLHFPKRKRDRCLVKFRGYLIDSRNEGILAASTSSSRMNSIIRFYRWAQTEGYVDIKQLWENKDKTIYFFDQLGFSRTFTVNSTDLSIPNRSPTSKLEDGLIPLAENQIKRLLQHLSQKKNPQLYLIHLIGFFTGCRFETITTLTIESLENAYSDPQNPHQLIVNVGPPTQIQTKYDVSGVIMFPEFLIQKLINYYHSPIGLIRRSKAKPEHKGIVLLTKHGSPYVTTSFSQLITALKNELDDKGYSEFKRYKFHQTRATFGTMLMKSLLEREDISVANAIEFVKDAMLHKHESTTWKYVKFIEKEPIKEAFQLLMWNMFTGNLENPEQKINELAGFTNA